MSPVLCTTLTPLDLDSVVRVPTPVVLRHVSQRSVDAALGGHRVRARGEQLGDAGALEPGLAEPNGGPQARSTSTNDDSIIGVINDGVRALQRRA